MKRYLVSGVVASIVVPIVIACYLLAFPHSPVMRVALALIPGFLPFFSEDPEREMSWVQFGSAVTLNMICYAAVAVLIGAAWEKVVRPKKY